MTSFGARSLPGSGAETAATTAAERGGVPMTPPQSFSFTVLGIPTAWARAGGGRSVARFTPQKQRSAMGVIKLFCSQAMRGAPPLTGPIELSIDAIYPRPKKALSLNKTSRPDADNIAKLVGDSLNGIAWNDDAQIVRLHVAKYYGTIPGLVVKVEAWYG